MTNKNLRFLTFLFWTIDLFICSQGNDEVFTLGLNKLSGRFKSVEWDNEKGKRLLDDIGDSSIIFGNSSSLNYYYVNIYLGTPPQRQAVIIDTGSHVLTTPCQPHCKHCGSHINSYYDMNKSNTSKILSCDECPSVMSSCNTNRCAFSSTYGEGSSLSGFYVKDVLKFGDTFREFSPGVLSFGCTTNENNLFYTQEADGIMGLGPSEHSFIPKLKNAGIITKKLFTLCFAPDGGYFSVGGVNTTLHKGAITYIPFYPQNFYKVKLKDVVIFNETLDIEHNGYYTIIDSGTTVTYFPNSLFEQVEKRVNKFCAQINRCLGDLFKSELGICFTLKENINYVQFAQSMPTLTFHLESNTIYEWKPENYLFDSTKSKDKRPTYCMGFVSWGSNEILLGSTWMHHHDIIFDLDNSRVGLVEADCNGASAPPPYRTAEVVDRPEEVNPIPQSPAPIIFDSACSSEVEMYKKIITVMCVVLIVLIMCAVIGLDRLRKGKSFLWMRVRNNNIENINLRRADFQLEQGTDKLEVESNNI